MHFKTNARRGLVALAVSAVTLSAACTTRIGDAAEETLDVASPEQLAMETIEAVRGDLEEVRGVLTAATDASKKGVGADLVAFNMDLGAVEALLNAADDALFEGNYSAADSLAISAAEAVGAVRGALAGGGNSDSK